MKRLEQHQMTKGTGKGRTVETVDPSTGEVLKGVFAFVPEAQKPFRKGLVRRGTRRPQLPCPKPPIPRRRGLCGLLRSRQPARLRELHSGQSGRGRPLDADGPGQRQQGHQAAGRTRHPDTRAEVGRLAYVHAEPQGWLEGEGPQPLQRPQLARKQGWQLIDGGKEQQLDLFNDPDPAPAEDAAHDRQ